MLERRSALASARPFQSARLRIEEKRGFALTQIAGFGRAFDKAASAVLGKLPTKPGMTLDTQGRTLMRTGPSQLWIIGPGDDDIAGKLVGQVLVTPLSHSRTRILMEGVPARRVLAKGIPLDFHKTAFVKGQFAMTGLHHTPVLIHCVDDDAFHIYAMRTFALSVWDWLSDAALEFADR
jgi:sarcosine oxidase subunit gamma